MDGFIPSDEIPILNIFRQLYRLVIVCNNIVITSGLSVSFTRIVIIFCGQTVTT